MMSVLSDFSLQQVGFDKELRDRINAAWRVEDYHTAANLIPDEMLDAFMLVGTREEVAAKAWRYREAGMDMPLLQPVVQEDDQVQAILDAAVIYGTQTATVPAMSHSGAINVSAANVATGESRSSLDDDNLTVPARAWRQAGSLVRDHTAI